MQPRESITTRHGKIAVYQTGAGERSLFFIHGNSSSSEVFEGQFESALAERYSLYAMDLPGHGASEDATDAEASYSMPSYAEAAADVIGALGLEAPVVMGWSLGGHVGLELTHLRSDVAGLIITGTPPSGPGAETVVKAFNQIPEIAFAGEEVFTEEQVKTFSRFIYSLERPIPANLEATVRRTDGRARRCMFGDFLNAESRLHPQIETVATWSKPLAVIQGTEEPFMSREYFGTLRYANLWRGAVQWIAGCGHAPFWEEPEVYNKHLIDFMDELG